MDEEIKKILLGVAELINQVLGAPKLTPLGKVLEKREGEERPIKEISYEKLPQVEETVELVRANKLEGIESFGLSGVHYDDESERAVKFTKDGKYIWLPKKALEGYDFFDINDIYNKPQNIELRKWFTDKVAKGEMKMEWRREKS